MTAKRRARNVDPEPIRLDVGHGLVALLYLRAPRPPVDPASIPVEQPWEDQLPWPELTPDEVREALASRTGLPRKETR